MSFSFFLRAMTRIIILLVIPNWILLENCESRSVNGSSAVGYCTDAIDGQCYEADSSVLFDGYIPALTGLDGDTWANQLLTIFETGSKSIRVAFSYPDSVVVARVEVVLFNCPQWGISIQDLDLDVGMVSHHSRSTIPTSCASLVRVCIPVDAGNHSLTYPALDIEISPNSSWVHLAEVRFYDGQDSTCPPDIILIQPSTDQPSPSAPSTTSTAHPVLSTQRIQPSTDTTEG